MGARGPIPKKDDERRRRNKPVDGETRVVTELPAAEDPESLPFRVREGREIPDLELVDAPEVDGWHPLARELWESAKCSGQALFYEPTDWAMLLIMCESLNRDLGEQVVGITETGEVIKDTIPLKGASLAAYLKASAVLGLTEGDRRRIGIELERRKFGQAKAPVRDIGQARANRLG